MKRGKRLLGSYAKQVRKILITRNKRRLKKAKDEIEVLTPEELLKKYAA